MKRSPSNNLYDLIRSLSKSEKRYLKLLMAQSMGKKRDLIKKLFDLIAESKEQRMIEIDKRITFTSHPSKLKNYLYNFILKGLAQFNSEKIENIRTRHFLNQIEVLFERGLFNQALTIIHKATKLAEASDSNELKMEALSLKVKVMERAQEAPNTEITDTLFSDLEGIAANLMSEISYRRLDAQLFTIHKRSGTILDKLDQQSEIVKHPLLQDYTQAKTFLSKHHYYMCWCMFYNYSTDHVSQIKFSQHLIDLYEERPKMKGFYVYQYLLALNMHALAYLRNKEYDKALELYLKMVVTKPSSPQEAYLIFERYGTNVTHLLLHKGDIDLTTRLLPEIIRELDKHEVNLTPLFKALLFSNLCAIYFVLEDFRKALRISNRLLNDEVKGIRYDVYRNTRMLNLIIHYELGHGDLLKKQVNQLRAFYAKQEHQLGVEKWFVSYMQQLVALVGPANKIFFRTQEKELLKVFFNREEWQIMDHFNLPAYLRFKSDGGKHISMANKLSAVEWDVYVKERLKDL